jgi:hypothetical protein
MQSTIEVNVQQRHNRNKTETNPQGEEGTLQVASEVFSAV